MQSSINIWRIVKGRIDHVRSKNPPEFEELKNIGIQLQLFISNLKQELFEEEDVYKFAKINGDRFLKRVNRQKRELLAESIREILMLSHYEWKLYSSKTANAALQIEINEAKSKYSIRKLLEMFVGGEQRNRGNVVANMMLNEEELRAAFNRNFKSAKFDNVFVKTMCLADKANLASTLFKQCYQNSSREPHWRPNSAPCDGVFVKKSNYGLLQQSFLRVVAELRKQNNVVIVKVEASDLDDIGNDSAPPLQYRIERGDPQSFFRIDLTSGYLTTSGSRKLDREKQAEHELWVSICDGGEPQLCSQVAVL
ncbi:unnamed protein product [Caenorhabditis angaria]|uniref:Cadherin domain-containing protein n=1 Tax=Caenorhabditis angaria TaxID=860376 RepID=A0A9P1IHC6_9PELO|nr:unnamed protein product [Caenorhabditis angaria]